MTTKRTSTKLADDNCITIAEAAMISGKSKSTIRNWIRRGLLTKYSRDLSRSNSAVYVNKGELAQAITPSQATLEFENSTAISLTNVVDNSSDLLREVEALKREIETKNELLAAVRSTLAIQTERLQDKDNHLAEMRLDLKSAKESIDKLQTQVNAWEVWAATSWWRRSSRPMLQLTDNSETEKQ